jgi:hypothetical protein
MPHVVLDFDPTQPDAPRFTTESTDLVWFLSWAFSQRYGASHELSTAGLVLRTEFGIDTQPLLTFADRNIEEPADEETLERAWQDAGPLATCCERVADALGSDHPRIVEAQVEYPLLRQNIQELGEIAQWAAEHGARIRVTYLLGD